MTHAVGIIAEYNPFHMGHRYHLQETLRITNKPVVFVMSGSVTQRGEFALYSKWGRGRAAVENGVNLVLELPAPYACAPADRFAWAAVYLLATTGVVDELSFGTESGNIQEIDDMCHLMADPLFDTLCREALAEGVSYPTAAARAAKMLGGDTSLLLDLPNNMLALCYLKALRALGAPMAPLTVKRHGAGHDRSDTNHGFLSAKELRSRILQGQPVTRELPPAMAQAIEEETANGLGPITLESQERLLLSKLRQLSIGQWATLEGVSEGLEQRLFRTVRQVGGYETLLASLKTKRYTMARLRRIVLSAYLDIQRSDTIAPPAYLRVLAFDDVGAQLLHTMRQTAQLPIITKPASHKEFDQAVQSSFQLECRVTDQMLFHRPRMTDARTGLELRTSPIYIKR